MLTKLKKLLRGNKMNISELLSIANRLEDAMWECLEQRSPTGDPLHDLAMTITKFAKGLRQEAGELEREMVNYYGVSE